MLIIVTKKDDNTVVAEIMEDNESFFESEELFKVMKNKDGSFTLTHTRIPSVKFTISKAGKIDYKHPKVNIDGTMYTLSISALKNTKYIYIYILQCRTSILYYLRKDAFQFLRVSISPKN